MIVSRDHKRIEKTLLTTVIPMAFYVPVRMGIIRVVLGCTTDFNLLESPLWQYRVPSPKITALVLMLEPETCRQRMDLIDVRFRPSLDIIHHFHNPVVLVITDSSISIASYFMAKLRNRGWNGMRMQIP